MTKSKFASVSKECIACGSCLKACPKNALSIYKGMYAVVNEQNCIGCGKCVKVCPASVISIHSRDKMQNTDKPVLKTKKKHWYDYLWIASSVYLILGFFNILFAWLGLICFFVPLMMAIIAGNKAYCNKYCGRGQLFALLGGKLGISFKKCPPGFLRSRWFRYGFLIFFMTMFLLMIYSTYLVFAGASLKEAVTLLWVFKLPWNWTNTAFVTPWIAQFAFGFYGVMLTSTVLGLITMMLFRPRSWCVYCPMGTMTKGICDIKNKGDKGYGKKSETAGGAIKSISE